MKKWINAILLIVVLSLGGCMRVPLKLPATDSETFVRVSAADIDFSDDLNFESLELAVERSIHYYEGAGENYVFRMPDKRVDARLLKDSLKGFLSLLRSKDNHTKLKDVIAAKFDVYRVKGEGDSGKVFFTGYYEPLLEGSLVRTEQYRYPIYRVPPDLV